jgi:NAD(P)-dependent dehydrogenase (short-subunit alcohol dehydrogenase family)
MGMESEPSSRVVLVTGASSGIGLATSIAFARAGETVVASLRDPTRSDALLAAARAADVGVEVEQLDVTDDESVRSCLGRVRGRYGRLDVLVNNAGVGVAGTLEEITLDDLRQSMEVNFFGAARMTRAVLPMMRARGGRIVAVSSLAGAIGQPFNDAYCAAKFALEGLYEALLPVVATFGIRLSLIEPGPVRGLFRERSSGVDGRLPTGPYAHLWPRFLAVADTGYADPESPEDVADLIVTVTRAEHPHLRYQTTPALERLIGIKLADLTGDRITGVTSRWLAAQEPDS